MHPCQQRDVQSCEKKLQPYMTDKKLAQCQHEHNTQCNEAVHSAVNVVAPKCTDFSRTNSLSGRVSIVAGSHTLGLVTFYGRVTSKLYCLPCTTQKNLEVREKKQKYKQEYDQKLTVKGREEKK